MENSRNRRFWIHPEGGELLIMSLVRKDAELPEWRKAKRSIGNGDCVEIAPADGSIAVRDSKDQAGPVLCYSTDTWKMFLYRAGRGDFDQLL